MVDSQAAERLTLHSVELAKIGLGVSGGDVALLETLRQLRRPPLKHVLHTTASGHATFSRRGLQPTPDEFEYRQVTGPRDERLGVTAAYAWRLTHALSPSTRSNGTQPAAVLTHSDILPTVLYGYRLARRNRLAWLAWSHMVLPDVSRGYRGQFTGTRHLPTYAFAVSAITQMVSLRLMARHASRVLTINAYTKCQLERRGVPGDRITVIPYGADHLIQSRTGNQPDQRYAAVFVGRFHDQKGVMDLPTIWARVRAEVPGARLAVVGDGPREITAHLEDALAERGLGGSVELLGFLDDDAKTDVLRSAGMLLFPSYYESWGLVALEALCQERPIVAYDLPVYDGLFSAGMLRAPVGDRESLAKLVIGLAGDRDRRQALGREGRQAVLRLRWADAAQQILDEVQRAIGL